MNRQEMIDNLKCHECDMSTHHKMGCSSKNVFDAFKKAVIWLPYMTQEQLDKLDVEIYAQLLERDIDNEEQMS